MSPSCPVFQWKWELLRRTGDGESRAVVVLALPPPDQAQRVDMDTLDCLQQVREFLAQSGAQEMQMFVRLSVH